MHVIYRVDPFVEARNTGTARFRLAAERGDANAQVDLGAMYHEGQGVPQDYKEAMRAPFSVRRASGQSDLVGLREKILALLIVGKYSLARRSCNGASLPLRKHSTPLSDQPKPIP